MIEIYPITFTKKDLEGIPNQEVIFYLKAAQFMNDISGLQKLMIFSTHYKGGHVIYMKAAHSYSLLLMKYLASLLKEAADFIKQEFSPLHQKYAPFIKAEQLELIKKVKQFYSKSNIVDDVRNKLGSHLDTDVLKNGYEAVPNNSNLTDYLSRYVTHSLYDACETVRIYSLASLIPEDSFETSYAAVVDTVVKKSGEMTTVLDDLIGVFYDIYLAEHRATENLNAGKFTIASGPDMEKVELTYFCKPPKWFEKR